MIHELIVRIRAHAISNPEGLPICPAADSAVRDAESKLGFDLPPLLKACYLEVGNGGFGPGYGLIGVEGGAESDFGSLVDTYRQLKSDQELESIDWQPHLLPFCSWGCNIFSCVDCSANDFAMYTFDEGDLRLQSYNLENFFELWMDNIDMLSLEDSSEVEHEIINPFTGEKSILRKKSKD